MVMGLRPCTMQIQWKKMVERILGDIPSANAENPQKQHQEQEQQQQQQQQQKQKQQQQQQISVLNARAPTTAMQ